MQTNDMSTTEKMREIVLNHPDFLYCYSPSGADSGDRYVFTDRTCFGVSSAYLRCAETPAHETIVPDGDDLMHGADLVAYTYKGDYYCAAHINGALDTGEGGTFDGWAVSGVHDRPDLADTHLTELALAFGIDREDETSFISDYFPKRVTRRMVDGDEVCSTCSGTLAVRP